MPEVPSPDGAQDFRAEEAAADFTQAPDYAAKKAAALLALEPPSPVNTRQRFAQQETTYDDPNEYPGVVRWRTENGGEYRPHFVQAAVTVSDSIEFLEAHGKAKAANEQRDNIGKRLRPQVEAGWRGTEFDDLEGIERGLTAVTERTAVVDNPERFREALGDEFPSKQL